MCGGGGSPRWTWRKGSGVPEASTPSQSATNLLAGVAVPTETASRLIADVWGGVWGGSRNESGVPEASTL